MYRILIIVIVLLNIIHSAYTQEDIDTSALDDTPAAECGAVDYLLAVYEYDMELQATTGNLQGLELENLVIAYDAISAYQQNLWALEPPDCVSASHLLNLEIAADLASAFTYLILSTAIEGDDPHQLVAVDLLGQIEELRTALDESLMEIGWLVPDGGSERGYRYVIEELND